MTVKPPPRYIESIPAVTAPVKLPRLVPSDARVVLWTVIGAVALAVCLAVFGVGLAVMS